MTAARSGASSPVASQPAAEMPTRKTPTAQRYRDPLSWQRMHEGTCPECGGTPYEHSSDMSIARMIGPGCSLLPRGVTERIEQYERDLAAMEREQ